MQICVCVNIFFAFLTSFLTVCRQELITNSQECIFKASSEQPIGTTDRKGFLSANRQEKAIFPDSVVLSVNS